MMFAVNDDNRMYALQDLVRGSLVFMLPCSNLQTDGARVAAIAALQRPDGARVTIAHRRTENEHWHATDNHEPNATNIMFRCQNNDTWMNYLWRPRADERPGGRETRSNTEIEVYAGVEGVNFGANIGLGFVVVCRVLRNIPAGDVLIGREPDDGISAPDEYNVRPGVASNRRPY